MDRREASRIVGGTVRKTQQKLVDLVELTTPPDGRRPAEPAKYSKGGRGITDEWITWARKYDFRTICEEIEHWERVRKCLLVETEKGND